MRQEKKDVSTGGGGSFLKMNSQIEKNKRLKSFTFLCMNVRNKLGEITKAFVMLI